MRNFPSDHIASGWYMIGWSWEFPTIGKPVALSYFERDLVAYRGGSGTLVVMDAYCKHMGAHLGDGAVEGDSIRCPYHGWLWDAEGRNQEIPYSSPDKMGRLRTNTWVTREIDDIVLVHYSHDGSPPLFEPPAQFNRLTCDTWAPSEATTKIWRDKEISPQYMAENAADAAHFKYVHEAHEVPGLGEYSVEGATFKARLDLRFGGHAASTWATPNGPVDGHVYTENWGMGIGWSRLVGFDDVIYLGCITPKSPYLADMRSTTWVARTRADGSEMTEAVRDQWVAQQNYQVDIDMGIWTTMSYTDIAPWANSEREPMRALRTWARQFYAEPAVQAVGS